MLLSDIHFKHQDLDRIQQTADWIASLPQRYDIQRVVICGDLLTTRSSQLIHVLDACYRFIGRLSDSVSRTTIYFPIHSSHMAEI